MGDCLETLLAAGMGLNVDAAQRRVAVGSMLSWCLSQVELQQAIRPGASGKQLTWQQAYSFFNQ